MIQIQTRQPLTDLAESFLQMAKNPKQGNITGKLIKKCNEAPKQQAEFWGLLNENLDKVLAGNPVQLQEIVDNIGSRFPNVKNWAEKSTSDLRKNLEYVFNYKGFSENKNNGWNAYWLADQLGVDTCLYCNRLYTHTVRKGSKNISRPQFDHFLDKVRYPYLAVSFFNLIPSCSVCNSGLKGSAKFSPDTHLHPFLEGFGNLVRFNLKIQDCSFFHGNIQSGKIEFKNKQTPYEHEGNLIARARQNISAFKLTDMYSQHIDYAQEQVSRALIYHTDYLDSLFKQFEGSLFRNREDLVRLVADNYIDEEYLSMRPLSKLTKDIAEQFGLWEIFFND